MTKVKLQLLITSVLLIITALSDQFTSADDSDNVNPNWVKPGWKSNRHRNAEEVPNAVEKCQCPAVPECPVGPSPKQTPTEEENNRLALVFYRKFLTRLFDERKFAVDEENPSFKLRNVQFKITDEQLRKLKEAQTAREIHAVVTSIVEQSDTGVYQSMAEMLGWNIGAWCDSAMHNPIFVYVIVPAVVMLFIGRWLRMRLWVLIFFIGIAITFGLTYLDCNNQLVLESLIKLMKTDGSNPCGKNLRSGWLNSLLQRNNEAECIEHLRVQYGLKRSFCDPSEVFIEMVTKTHMHYIKTFVLKMVYIFEVCTASSGVMETLFIRGFILVLLLITFLLQIGIPFALYVIGRFSAVLITNPGTREQAAVQGDARQAAAQLPPTTSLNNSININQPRIANSGVDQTTNRIEEIPEGGSEPNVAASVEATSRRTEDGSGDGPAVKNKTTDGETIPK